MDTDKASDEVNSTVAQLLQTDNDEERKQNLRTLRNMCSKGSEYQEAMATHDSLNDWLHEMVFNDSNCTGDRQLQSLGWQLLGNLTVSNSTGQREIYKRHGSAIVAQLETIFDKNTSAQLFILYNILIGGTRVMPDKLVLRTCVRVWQRMLDEKINEDVEFLHFIFEIFVAGNPQCTKRCYPQMDPADRISFLDYVANYLREGSPNGLLTDFMLKYLCTDFKNLSDVLLRHSTTVMDQMQSREVHALLKVLANSSGSEKYDHVLANDHNLFLNVSSLLRCLIAAGQEPTSNAFTPMSRLEEVAPASKISKGFESEVSFELKTLLVRCIANLLHKNKTNQMFCLDTNLMPALFECTNMDARNPLMKEWSILAIRNACDGCLEIQNIVANLSQQSIHQRDFISELNLQMGSMRIQPRKENSN